MSPVGRALAAAAARLADAGIASARVDAELLLSFVLGVERGRLLLVDDLRPEEAERFARLVAARADRVPLQHLTGFAPFRSVHLRVGPGVFVPRPETELLVDTVLPHLRRRPAPVVVDLCAGSGALAVALASELPSAAVVAVECSAEALPWLRANAEPDGVEVVVGDVRDDRLLQSLRGGVDAVLSNPPYVPSGTSVAPEVHADPPVAVFAGPDGLDLMPSVLARAAELLRAGGIAAVEHDETHASSVLALLERDGRWEDVAGRADLAGRPRFALARRSADGPRR